ncbi:MAG: hypothetical protein ACK55Z_17655, partial [bacterium]
MRFLPFLRRLLQFIASRSRLSKAIVVKRSGASYRVWGIWTFDRKNRLKKRACKPYSRCEL